MPRGRLFVVTGPSGVGKGTLIKELLRRVPEFSLDGKVTWSEGTVRGPRRLPIKFG